jgi:hypothetical protein
VVIGAAAAAVENIEKQKPTSRDAARGEGGGYREHAKGEKKTTAGIEPGFFCAKATAFDGYTVLWTIELFISVEVR